MFSMEKTRQVWYWSMDSLILLKRRSLFSRPGFFSVFVSEMTLFLLLLGIVYFLLVELVVLVVLVVGVNMELVTELDGG